jgi:phosphatidylserine decarboxylase
VVAHRRSIIAGEGWPWLIVLAICGVFIGWIWGPLWASPVAILCILKFFLFRDPERSIPPLPLAVVAPIDGRITKIEHMGGDVLPGDWTRITVRTNHFGAYTVRSPIEGAIHDVRENAGNANLSGLPGGLWVRSEEDDDVVLLFPRDRFGFAPKAFVRYGERVGQGQRFAYLRLAPRAEVYLPATAVVRVHEGDRVMAGSAVLAELAPK